MRVILGADHGGFELKETVKSWLTLGGHEVIDVGAALLTEGDDFTEYAKAAVREAKDPEDRIILFCRNGYGMSIMANRFKGVRCGVAFDVEAVRKGRTDDDLNCLSIPSDYVGSEAVQQMINMFLETEFSNGEKYARRIMKLDNIES